jgi:hypothetical protein
MVIACTVGLITRTWLGGEEQQVPAAAAVPVMQAHGAEDGTDVDRRGALRVLTTGAVAVTGVGAVLVKDSPWQRLVDSLKGKRPADPATVTLLEDRTADFFRAEETTPARQLLLSLRQHREDVRTLAVNTENAQLKRRLIASAGETDALTQTSGSWSGLLFNVDHVVVRV